MNNSNITAPELCFPDTRSSRGQPVILNTADNLATLIEFYGFSAKVNLMNLETEVFHQGVFLGSSDRSRSKLVSLCSIHGVPKSAIDDHLIAIAESNTYHPVLNWLNGDEWDGIERVDDVINCLQAKDKKVANTVLKRWLVGCVASLVTNNFKSKLIPVLQGDQSFRKTSFIERLAMVIDGAFLEGAELNPDNKDSVLSVIRSWIVELGELERSTANSQGSLKAFTTKMTDTVRPPYARADIKKKRQTSLIATVNGSDFLKDRTGNSRYAVIPLIGVTDMERLNQILGWEYKSTGELILVDEYKLRQFWLEVRYLLEHNNYSWNLSETERALVEETSNQYLDKGEHYVLICEHLASCSTKQCDWMTSKQICSLIGINVSKANVVGKALTMMNSEGKLDRKFSGGVNKYLFPS
jgi:predicted P-loop ATPase